MAERVVIQFDLSSRLTQFSRFLNILAAEIVRRAGVSTYSASFKNI
jgi:hypothetical protein